MAGGSVPVPTSSCILTLELLSSLLEHMQKVTQQVDLFFLEAQHDAVSTDPRWYAILVRTCTPE